MFISVSRRTDILAHYSEWFLRRLKEGEVLVRNHMNPRHVSKIKLTPDVLDGIVFWTKNPKPILNRIKEIDYPFYFQFTITPYDSDIERNLPNKQEIVESFLRLSDMIGADRVIWRYDPVLINRKYSIGYHAKHFEDLASKLGGYTNKCIISFIDYYNCIAKAYMDMGTKKTSNAEINVLAQHFSNVALLYNLNLSTCAESIDLSDYGISHAKCIDAKIFSNITGYRYNLTKDKNQRKECGCTTSIDIGAYNTCLNGCRYCYANHSEDLVKNNHARYDSISQLLCDSIKNSDEISLRKVKSIRSGQMQFDL